MIQQRLRTGRIGLLYRQIAIMLSSGMSFAQAMKTLRHDNENLKVEKMVNQVNQEIDQGIPMSQCLLKHPCFFSKDLVNILYDEQNEDILAGIFKTMADEKEKSEKLFAGMIKVALLPVISLVLAFMIILFLLFSFMPVINSIFVDFGTSLPMPTQLFISVGNTFLDNIIVIILLLGAGILFGLLPGFKTARYSLACRVPFLGRYIEKIFILKFIRYLARMLLFNLPLDKAVSYSAMDNPVYGEQLKHIGNQAGDTGRLMAEMRQAGFFPKLVLQAVKVGDTTGSLQTVLVELSEYYEKEIDLFTTGFLSVLHVGMLLFVGSLVGWIVVAVYMPIFTMAGSL